MSPRDWYGGLRRVDALEADEAAALVATYRGAAEASERLNPRPPPTAPYEPRVRVTRSAPVRVAPITLDISDFTPHERALFRVLCERFPSEKAVELVCRSRGARTS